MDMHALQFSAIEPVSTVLGLSIESKKQASLILCRGSPTVSSYTSDSGWGCIMRTGQMLLALALMAEEDPSHHFRWTSDLVLRIIKLFADQTSAPFSLHQIVTAGATMGKKVGEWYGPTVIAAVLRDLVNNKPGQRLRVYVSRDSGIYLPDLNPMLAKGPILLLLPMRLGSGSSVSSAYVPMVQTMFLSKSFVGIIGGRPSASFFFFAAQMGDIFYLDPHETQPVANLASATEIPKSYVCTTPMQMRIVDLDPCMTAGFLLRTEADLADLRTFWKARNLGSISSFIEVALSRSADILAVDDFDEL